MRQLNRWSPALVVLAAVLAVCCGSRTVHADPAIHEIGDDPGLGFNLISWGTAAQAQHWVAGVETMYLAGFREVSIAPVRIVDPNTGIITSTGQQSLANIEAGIAHAKFRGMRVTLDPFTEYPDVGQTWRANYSPDSPEEEATFWSNYQAYMVEVAELAQEYDVEAMTVGTEMKGLDDNPNNAGHWNDVLTAVNAVYDGQIGYAANWDNYNSPNVVNNLWSHPAVDFIGIDSYFRFQNGPYAISTTLTNPIQTYPTQSFIDVVTEAWTGKLENEILPFVESVGKPLVFTEIGYQHHNGTARNPQTEQGNLDTAEQRMAFQGFLNAIDGRADIFQAVHIWQWSMNGNAGSTWDIGNDPDNEDLEQFLRAFALTSVHPIEGDYNRDGLVNAADYTVWRDTLGNFVANYHAADGNGNGRIDMGDYGVWKANFGNPQGGGLVTVPEPTTGLLLVIATAIMATTAFRNR